MKMKNTPLTVREIVEVAYGRRSMEGLVIENGMIVKAPPEQIHPSGEADLECSGMTLTSHPGPHSQFCIMRSGSSVGKKPDDR